MVAINGAATVSPYANAARMTTPASSTTSPATFDLQAIMDAAYRNLGQIQADADLQQAQAQANLSRLLSATGDARKKSTKDKNDSNAGRGLLNSGINLDELSQVSQYYDQQNAGYQGTYDDTARQIAAKRLAAQNDYVDAQGKYARGVATDSATAAINAALMTPTPVVAAAPIAAPSAPRPVSATRPKAIATPVVKPAPIVSNPGATKSASAARKAVVI